MEMQIPQLRQLFEARVRQIAHVLAADTPPELGRIDPTLRGLKGFLFALEGMLRKDELQGLPFTARQELFERVGGAISAMRSLPEALSREQALGVLHAIDGLHRFCLQENLMASNLDASKLGKLTVILERRLGDVLGAIDGVADTGAGRAREIEQAADRCLAEIHEIHRKEAEVLTSGASLAIESIRNETEVIRERQADAVVALNRIHQELGQKRQQVRERLDEHVTVTGRLVDEVRGEQQAAGELLARARGQLDEARTAIEAVAEVIRGAETAREGLQARLSEGQEVVTSIRGLLETGTEAAAEISAKNTAAGEHLAHIEQTADRCARSSQEARAHQASAVAEAQATVQAAERMQAETQQTMDDRLEAAAQVLAGITSHREETAGLLAQVQQQRQAADEAGQATEQVRQAAAERAREAGEALAQLRGLLVHGEQAAGRLDGFVEAGAGLKDHVARTLAEAGALCERIGQVHGEAAKTGAAMREQMEDALAAGRKAVAEVEHQQRQFERVFLEQREAARDAVAGLGADQAIAAELLGHTRQSVEALQGEVQQVHACRTSAGDAEARLRAKLDQAGGVVGQLDGVLAGAGDLRAQIECQLAGAVEAHERLQQLGRETAASADDLRRRQEEALAIVRGEAAATEAQRKACETSIAEQLETVRSAAADVRDCRQTAEGLLDQVRQQRDAARDAAQATGAVRLTTAEASGEVQAELQEARRWAAELTELLSAGTLSRSRIDAELAAAAHAAGELGNIRQELAESCDQVRQHEQAMAEAGARSQQSISEMRTSGQAVLDGMAGRSAELVARGEQLQQHVEALLGQAADGGLYRQFDDLAEQSAPRRARWLRLLMGSGAGGAAVLAVASAILAGAVSPWAAGAALAAGLAPLAYFLRFCASQYDAERRAEDRHRNRAAVSRSLTAYRKLLTAMRAEGIADSAFVDRMLATLFATTENEGGLDCDPRSLHPGSTSEPDPHHGHTD